MKYITTRAMSFGGRRYGVGDPIELSSRYGKILTATGRVEEAPGAGEEKYGTEPAAKPKRKRGRPRKVRPEGEAQTYKTRRLKADDA